MRFVSARVFYPKGVELFDAHPGRWALTRHCLQKRMLVLKRVDEVGVERTVTVSGLPFQIDWVDERAAEEAAKKAE